MPLLKFIPTVRNFTALAQTVASNWRVVDADTLSYCNSVAKLLKKRHAELVKTIRSGLPPQYPKEKQQQQQQQQHQHQRKKKKLTKSTTITAAAVAKTTTPMAGAKTNASWQQLQLQQQQQQPWSFDDDTKTSMPTAAINTSAWVSNLNQLSVDGGRRATTRLGSSYIHENMERASATVTPLGNIFDEVARFNQEYRHGASNEGGHQNTSSMLTLMYPTEERKSPHDHDMHPPSYWEKFTNPAPDDEDVVDISNREVHEMWGIVNDE